MLVITYKKPSFSKQNKPILYASHYLQKTKFLKTKQTHFSMQHLFVFHQPRRKIKLPKPIQTNDKLPSTTLCQAHGWMVGWMDDWMDGLMTNRR